MSQSYENIKFVVEQVNMKNPFLILVLISISTSVLSQEFNIPYRKGELWGMANSTGKIIAEPKYDWVSDKQDNNRWFVFKDGLMGVIDENGKEVLAPIYDTITRDPKHSQYNDFYVILDNNIGYYSMDGEEIISINYDMLHCADYDYYKSPDPYNFFIGSEKDYSIIDSSEKTILAHIKDVRNISDGNYLLNINDLWGAYNLNIKKWSFEPKFDSIKVLYQISYNELKEEYAGYRYCGYLGENLYLITSELVVTKIGKMDDSELFEDATIEEMYDEEVIAPGYADGRYNKTIDLRAFVIQVSQNMKLLNEYYTKITAIYLTESKKKIGANIHYQYSEQIIPSIYDSIKVCVDDKGKMQNQYLLLNSKDKWGIFGLKEVKIVVPVEMDSISFFINNPSTFQLKQKGKMGIFKMAYYRNEKSVFISPEYDSYVQKNYIRSIGFDYEDFELFYFMKGDKLCPVGENGVKFYAD